MFSDDDEETSKETLLEMSERFQETYPEKYALMMKERADWLDDLRGSFASDPLVEAINLETAQKFAKAKEESIRRKNMPPLLHLRFQFYEHSKAKDDDDENKGITDFLEDLFDESDDYITTFEYKDEDDLSPFSFFRSDKNEECSDGRKEKELCITVVEATNLHKWVDGENNRLKRARVTCTMQPDSEKYGPEMETKYKKPNDKNETKWIHLFLIRGFSLEQLVERMLTFTVDARTKEGKRRIGYLNLSREGCVLGRVSPTDTMFCDPDPHFWARFLSNHKEPLDVHLPLFPSELPDKSNTFLRRIASTISRSTPKRRKNLQMETTDSDASSEASQNPSTRKSL